MGLWQGLWLGQPSVLLLWAGDAQPKSTCMAANTTSGVLALQVGTAVLSHASNFDEEYGFVVEGAKPESLVAVFNSLRLSSGSPPPGLTLYKCLLDVETLQGCHFLAPVTKLSLNHCYCTNDDDLTDAAAALLVQAPQVQSLELTWYHGYGAPSLPAVISSGALTQLTQLKLSCTKWADLEAGPYLAGARLACTMRPVLLGGILAGSEADAALRSAASGGGGDPLPPLQAGLQDLELRVSDLAQLPPALSQATALTHLSLAHNEQLRITAAEAAATLGRVPSLRSLDLSGRNNDSLPPGRYLAGRLSSRRRPALPSLRRLLPTLPVNLPRPCRPASAAAGQRAHAAPASGRSGACHLAHPAGSW